MQIKELGEFGLIDRLTKEFPIVNKSTELAVGDDCAILDYTGKKTLVTKDLLLEGVHFDLTYCPLLHLGYKSAIVNFSDVYAMNGKPKQMVVGLGVSSKLCVEDLDELYAGMKIACEEHGVDLIGGDTTASLTGLTISITCIGEGEEGKIVKRSGAKDTDLICVTGDLGAAYMGLLLLEREKEVFNSGKGSDPDFAGKEYLIERQLKPRARKDIIESLERINVVPTSMMDISDGLSSELLHICKASHVGCRIYEDRIPIDYLTAHMAEEMNMNMTMAAMNGGEDYELLFTIPLSMHDTFKALTEVTLPGVPRPDIKIIGHITAENLGARMITRGGGEIDIQAQGWNSLKE